MTRLPGIYMEKDYYRPWEIGVKHIAALRVLGIGLRVEPDGSVRILDDTAGQRHKFCDCDERDMVMRRRVD